MLSEFPPHKCSVLFVPLFIQGFVYFLWVKSGTLDGGSTVSVIQQYFYWEGARARERASKACQASEQKF